MDQMRGNTASRPQAWARQAIQTWRKSAIAGFMKKRKEAGGAGFQVTAYTQTWSDVSPKAVCPVLGMPSAGSLTASCAVLF